MTTPLTQRFYEVQLTSVLDAEGDDSIPATTVSSARRVLVACLGEQVGNRLLLDALSPMRGWGHWRMQLPSELAAKLANEGELGLTSPAGHNMFIATDAE